MIGFIVIKIQDGSVSTSWQGVGVVLLFVAMVAGATVRKNKEEN